MSLKVIVLQIDSLSPKGFSNLWYLIKPKSESKVIIKSFFCGQKLCYRDQF